MNETGTLIVLTDNRTPDGHLTWNIYTNPADATTWIDSGTYVSARNDQRVASTQLALSLALSGWSLVSALDSAGNITLGTVRR